MVITPVNSKSNLLQVFFRILCYFSETPSLYVSSEVVDTDSS